MFDNRKTNLLCAIIFISAKNIGNIDRVITDGEVVGTSIRGLGPIGRTVGNTFRVAPV